MLAILMGGISLILFSFMTIKIHLVMYQGGFPLPLIQNLDLVFASVFMASAMLISVIKCLMAKNRNWKNFDILIVGLVISGVLFSSEYHLKSLPTVVQAKTHQSKN
jgi:hypothetical protein